MAFGNLTIDASKLRRIPVRDRAAIASSPYGSEIFGNLSPIDIAKLFPSYYKEKLNAMAGERSGFGNAALSTVKFGGGSGGTGFSGGATGKSGGGGSGTAVAAPPARPEYIESLIQIGGGTTKKINQSPFFDAIMKSEGTSPEQTAAKGFANPFDVVLGYGAYGMPEKPITEMSIGELYQFQRNVLLPNKLNSSAAGAFQIVSRNIVGADGELSVFMKRAGLSLNDKFDENAQRRLAWEIYKEQGLGAWEGLKLHPDLWQQAQQAAEHVRIDEIESDTSGVSSGTIDGTQPIDGENPANETGVEPLRQPFDPSMLDQLDPRLKQFYSTATDAEKRALERAIEKLGIDGVQEHMKKFPGRSADSVTAGLLENVIEEQQQVAGVRKGAITANLKESLSYAAEQAGDDKYRIEVRVTSGGQRMEGAPGAKGSHRHDDGGAADFNAYLVDRETNQKILLDPRNPDHIPYISRMTTEFSRVHPSAGVGALYMDDPTKIHFGGDDVSEDGGRARGPMAYEGPDWFRKSHAQGIEQRTQDEKDGRSAIDEWRQKKIEAASSTVAQPVPEQSVTPPAAPTAAPVSETATEDLKKAEDPVPQRITGGDVNVDPKEEYSVIHRESGKNVADIGPGEQLKLPDKGSEGQVSNAGETKAKETEQKSTMQPQNMYAMRSSSSSPTPTPAEYVTEIDHAPRSPSFQRAVSNPGHYEKYQGQDVA